jgi:hypothetical protein
MKCQKTFRRDTDSKEEVPLVEELQKREMFL